MIEPFTDAEIIEYARGVVTDKFMLADIREPDWMMSMALLLCAWEEVPTNLSTLFLVPVHKHTAGRWLNGRVPGVTISAVPVAVESCEPLMVKVQEFWMLLNPDTPEVTK